VIPVRYSTIVADPAWPYEDALASGKDNRMGKVNRAASGHYQTMSIQAICDLGQRGPLRIAGYHINYDSFLWLWVTNPILIDGSAARVAKAWGFNPRQLVTWVKGRVADDRLVLNVGLGHLTRGATEHLLLCTRGRSKHLLKNRRTPNVFVAPRGRHSEKPQAAFDLVEQLTPSPYLELFARAHRPGWHCWGNEVDGPQSEVLEPCQQVRTA
jgi:N6-adenosine-specific RNA methylase IME4